MSNIVNEIIAFFYDKKWIITKVKVLCSLLRSGLISTLSLNILEQQDMCICAHENNANSHAVSSSIRIRGYVVSHDLTSENRYTIIEWR